MDSIELDTGNNSDKKDMKMVIRTECSRKNVITGSSKDGLNFFCTSNIDNNYSNAESPAEESVSSERIAGVFPRRNIFDLTSTEESKSNMLSLKHKGEMFRKIETGESVSDLATPYNVAITTTSDIQNKKRTLLPFASNWESKSNNSSSSDFNVGCSELSKTSTQQHLPDVIKIEIIERLEEGVSSDSLSHIYEVSRETLISLKTHKDKMLNRALRDNTVYMWYLETLYDVEVVTETDLCKKALELNKRLSGPSNFKAGRTWLNRFKSRYGTKQLQKKITSNGETRSNKYLQFYLKKLQSEGFSPDDVYTANVFEIEWQSMPQNSLFFKRYRKWCQKPERITVMVCENTTWSHALRLLVIGNNDCFQRVLYCPLNYQSQENCLMSFKILREWYKNEFIPDVKTEYTLGEKGKKILLLHNVEFRENLKILHEDEENFEVRTLPPQLTPVDQIMKLKRTFKTNILRNLLSPTENEEITDYLEKCYCMLDKN